MWTVRFPFSKMNELALIHLENTRLTKTSNLQRAIYNVVTLINNFIKRMNTLLLFTNTLKSTGIETCETEEWRTGVAVTRGPGWGDVTGRGSGILSCHAKLYFLCNERPVKQTGQSVEL